MERPNLLSYDNYRTYLKDWYQWMKGAKPAFSYRAFSQWAGFKSPNQLLLVIQGRRNISLGSLDKYYRALKLKRGERKYFELLVKFNQAKNMETQLVYFQELKSYHLKAGMQLRGTQYEYLSNWYFPAIREMVNLKDFRENGQWIAKRLKGRISPRQAQTALDLLRKLGLIERKERGRLTQTADYVTTGDETGEVAAAMYHHQMIDLAKTSLERGDPNRRNLSALTFTIRARDFKAVIEEINDFRKRVVATLQNRDKTDEDEAVYQLNIHLFPTTEQENG